MSDEIREVRAFRFAGQLYHERADAEYALTKSNLTEFVSANEPSGLDGIQDPTPILRDWLLKHSAKIVSILNQILRNDPR